MLLRAKFMSYFTITQSVRTVISEATVIYLCSTFFFKQYTLIEVSKYGKVAVADLVQTVIGLFKTTISCKNMFSHWACSLLVFKAQKLHTGSCH